MLSGNADQAPCLSPLSLFPQWRQNLWSLQTSMARIFPVKHAGPPGFAGDLRVLPLLRLHCLHHHRFRSEPLGIEHRMLAHALAGAFTVYLLHFSTDLPGRNVLSERCGPPSPDAYAYFFLLSCGQISVSACTHKQTDTDTH